MKKATKLLTVVAMAATLILGAGAFVSCSNSSDSSSSTQTAEQKAEALEKQLDKMVEDFEALDYQEITEENVKSWMGGGDGEEVEYSLSDEAKAFNDMLEDVQKWVNEWTEDDQSVSTQSEDGEESESEDEGDKNDEEDVDWDAVVKFYEETLETAKEKAANLEKAFNALTEAEQKAATLGKNPDANQ